MSTVKARLEYLRGELRGECISQGELAELQSLAEHIDPGDVELLEAAGVPEHRDTEPPAELCPGSTLANGAVVVALREYRPTVQYAGKTEFIVLAVRTDSPHEPWATWMCTDRWDTTWGHYHYDFERALEDWRNR